MSTLHLVELDDEDNILDEVEIDDEVIAALESEDEDTELSLSDDNSRLALVELDDDGEIVAVEELGAEDDEDDEEEGAELSQESETSEGDLELGIGSFVKAGIAGAKSFGGKVARGMRKMRASGATPMKRLTAAPNFTRVGGGTTALSRNTGLIKRSKLMGLSGRGKLAVAGAATAGGAGAVGLSNRKKGQTLSLGNDLLVADKNPLLIDASARK